VSRTRDRREAAGPDPGRDPAASPHPSHGLGSHGEAKVLALLLRLGFEPVGRNVAVAGVELDLVVRRGREVLVVEVKTRRGAARGEEGLSREQRLRLHRALVPLARMLRCRRADVTLVLAAVRPGQGGEPEVCFFGIPLEPR